MLFPTAQFALFFLIVLSISWLVRRKRVYQKLFLLAVSYFFYGWWDWRFPILLLVSSLLDYICGEGIVWCRRSDPERTQPVPEGAMARFLSAFPDDKRFWLLASIFFNVALLGFFKYYNFFQENLTALAGFFGLQAHLAVLEVILPLGISFYTFQSLAYTFDLYFGHGDKAASLLDFLLFLAFFPQLLLGPICRSRDLLPQLMREHPEKVPDLTRAISLIGSGLFKKVFLATFLGTHLVNDAFVAPENYSSLELLVAIYAYTAMIYCDFSGYTDLARGTGLLLGFHLPENFNAPLASTNIGEFWRRWHMSYSRWLRDYIYFPLGGSKGNPLRTYFNLFVTFLVGGLWHGAHWKFVIWGIIHAFALIGYKASLDLRRYLGWDLKKVHPWWYLLCSWFVTFHICALARVFFRSVDMETAGMFFSRLAELSVYGRGIELMLLLATALGIGLNFFGRHIRVAFEWAHDRVPAFLRPVAWILVAWLLVTVKPADVAPYIYFAF
ncbi:MAG: MBOAT family protein [Deltaproteobacteria bacterium]|nr:MBOAT family protein [Deltaproteobacteria bacterium]